jgi:carbonic anhydrase
MTHLPHLFANNRAWAQRITERDPDFFEGLAAQQSPSYLWIGCADSRVPANEIVGLRPGELFVHRNVANVVVHTDLNCLSVIQYAVDVLQVAHVILCGHYDCGGVRAAYLRSTLGLIDNWLRHVQDVRDRHRQVFAAIDTGDDAVRRLCELNVVEQVRHVAETTIMHDAWRRGQAVLVHGWIYDVRDGLLHDLHCTIARATDIDAVCARAIAELQDRNVTD